MTRVRAVHEKMTRERGSSRTFFSVYEVVLYLLFIGSVIALTIYVFLTGAPQ